MNEETSQVTRTGKHSASKKGFDHKQNTSAKPSKGKRPAVDKKPLSKFHQKYFESLKPVSIIRLSQAMGCGGCKNITSIESEFTCKTCGRMLCGECGDTCLDHLEGKEVNNDIGTN